MRSRALAWVLVTAVGASGAGGCLSQTYSIPRGELYRLAMTPPEARGQEVRVVQDLASADPAPPAPVVYTNTTIVVVPSGGEVGPHPGPEPPLGGGGGGVSGPTSARPSGSAEDAKAQAIVYLTIAATAAIVLAATEGSRYDGWVQLHPMMPVHLWGPGGYTVVPLAQLDPQTAAWAERAVVVPTEGPWRELGRAPLDRAGLTYSMLIGASDVVSNDGSVQAGAGGHIMIGGYPSQMLGILADFGFAWGPDQQQQATNFAARFGVELDVLPIDLGPLHGGLYGEAGFVHRIEDNYADSSGLRGEVGTLIQLGLTTRLALTARLGVGEELGARVRDASIGLSIY